MPSRLRTVPALVAATAAAFSMGVTGGVAIDTASAASRSPVPHAVSKVRNIGKPVVVRVHPERRLSVTLRGVVRITAKRGTFRSPGRMVIRRVRGAFTTKRALRAAGLGVSVRFIGTAPRRALKLTYRTGRLPRGFRPRVLHVARDGSSSLQKARVTRAGRLQVRTRSFSSLVPAWLNPKRWLSNLHQWGRNAADWVASGVGGRTQPPTGCGVHGPDWFHFDKRSDLVHVCSIDNKGRGEIQIKSNRGLSQVIHVPGEPAYIWVEDLPYSIRRLMPWSKVNDVILGPGQLMTVGYNRPQVDTNLTFTSSIHAGWANLDNIVRASLDVLGVPRGSVYAVVAVAYTKCVTDLEPSLGELPLDAELTVRKAFCVLDAIEELAQDPEQALKFAAALGLDDEGRDKLLAGARGLSIVARRTAEFGLVKDYAVRSIDDALRELFYDGNDQIGLTMAGVPAPVATPSEKPPPPQPVRVEPVSPPAPRPEPSPVQPPATQAPAQPSPPPAPSTRKIVVDNRVTNGSTQMREDTSAYLSTVTRNFCKRDGCALGATDMGSGATITAECTTFGSRTTNGQDDSGIDDGNPGLYSSTRWYGIRWGDGRFGYISEVWIRADHRGGLGLRGC